jgi:hypothetical protein
MASAILFAKSPAEGNRERPLNNQARPVSCSWGLQAAGALSGRMP